MNAETETAGAPRMVSLDAYRAERKQLITAREGFFFAIRAYLRPEQRPDAQALGDRLWRSPARHITDEDWVCNPTRGYVTILENAAAGRLFRLSVLQQGTILRIGIRVPAGEGQEDVVAHLIDTFPHEEPTMTELTTDDTFVDWEFDATRLYQCAQEMESAIYYVNALFERALQVTVPVAKETPQ